jgi:hypothetical protein
MGRSGQPCAWQRLEYARQLLLRSIRDGAGYARLGDTQAALGQLESALVRRHHLMVFIACEPLFNALHDEPRFIALCNHIGV